MEPQDFQNVIKLIYGVIWKILGSIASFLSVSVISTATANSSLNSCSLSTGIDHWQIFWFVLVRCQNKSFSLSFSNKSNVSDAHWNSSRSMKKHVSLAVSRQLGHSCREDKMLNAVALDPGGWFLRRSGYRCIRGMFKGKTCRRIAQDQKIQEETVHLCPNIVKSEKGSWWECFLLSSPRSGEVNVEKGLLRRRQNSLRRWDWRSESLGPTEFPKT